MPFISIPGKDFIRTAYFRGREQEFEGRKKK
jgi:hypothetical protein